ncbi:DUF5994 family protein [Nocardioides sp. SYSU DS0651]|uniref:DUF5994 family protein n=1 Tax=Nocardioides sp. SYSU DS0651 TaxID=3415955 RepID=UPI003F4BBC42
MAVTASPPPSPTAASSTSLRLSTSGEPGAGRLDGGWWPHSRDLAAELRQLVEGFPPELGRIVRALYSPPDWDTPARRIPLRNGFLKVGSFPDDDTHVIVLTTADRTVLRFLVVPADFNDAQGAEALLAAATPRYAHSATELLRTVTDAHAADPDDVWPTDGGESAARIPRTRGRRTTAAGNQ